MPTSVYLGFTYVTPFDPAYVDLWGPPLNNALIALDAAHGRAQVSGCILSPKAMTYPLITKTRKPFTVKSATFYTDAGTLTAAVKINSTDVTSLSAVAVTSAEASTTATGANTAIAADDLKLAISSPSGVTVLAYNIWVDVTGEGTA
jgi:hypothetical protein